MCKSIDVAIAMVNRSIEFADNGQHPEYYMDFVKLHKLMYAGYCYLKSKYDTDLFEEKITAHHCGPLVDGLSQIPGICGFNLITEPLNHEDFGVINMPLSYFRKEAIEKALEKYGNYTTEEIVTTVKRTSAYSKYRDLCNEHPALNLNSIVEAGRELFE